MPGHDINVPIGTSTRLTYPNLVSKKGEHPTSCIVFFDHDSE